MKRRSPKVNLTPHFPSYTISVVGSELVTAKRQKLRERREQWAKIQSEQKAKNEKQNLKAQQLDLFTTLVGPDATFKEAMKHVPVAATVAVQRGKKRKVRLTHSDEKIKIRKIEAIAIAEHHRPAKVTHPFVPYFKQFTDVQQRQVHAYNLARTVFFLPECAPLRNAMGKRGARIGVEPELADAWEHAVEILRGMSPSKEKWGHADADKIKAKRKGLNKKFKILGYSGAHALLFGARSEDTCMRFVREMRELAKAKMIPLRRRDLVDFWDPSQRSILLRFIRTQSRTITGASDIGRGDIIAPNYLARQLTHFRSKEPTPYEYSSLMVALEDLRARLKGNPNHYAQEFLRNYNLVRDELIQSYSRVPSS